MLSFGEKEKRKGQAEIQEGALLQFKIRVDVLLSITAIVTTETICKPLYKSCNYLNKCRQRP